MKPNLDCKACAFVQRVGFSLIFFFFAHKEEERGTLTLSSEISTTYNRPRNWCPSAAMRTKSRSFMKHHGTMLLRILSWVLIVPRDVSIWDDKGKSSTEDEQVERVRENVSQNSDTLKLVIAILANGNIFKDNSHTRIASAILGKIPSKKWIYARMAMTMATICRLFLEERKVVSLYSSGRGVSKVTVQFL